MIPRTHAQGINVSTYRVEVIALTRVLIEKWMITLYPTIARLRFLQPKAYTVIFE